MLHFILFYCVCFVFVILCESVFQSVKCVLQRDPVTHTTEAVSFVHSLSMLFRSGFSQNGGHIFSLKTVAV